MKVSINFTLDIDPKAWESDFGIEGTQAIRKDVQSYVEGECQERLRDMGLLVDKPKAVHLGWINADGMEDWS